MTKAFEDAVGAAPIGWWTNAKAAARRGALATMTGKGIANFFGRYFPALNEYTRALDRQNAEDQGAQQRRRGDGE